MKGVSVPEGEPRRTRISPFWENCGGSGNASFNPYSMAVLGLFDQKIVIAVNMPIATAFKFCIRHRKKRATESLTDKSLALVFLTRFLYGGPEHFRVASGAGPFAVPWAFLCRLSTQKHRQIEANPLLGARARIILYTFWLNIPNQAIARCRSLGVL